MGIGNVIRGKGKVVVVERGVSRSEFELRREEES